MMMERSKQNVALRLYETDKEGQGEKLLVRG